MFSIIGFILDMNERVDNVFLILFEVIMMTLIAFGLLIVIMKVIESMKMKSYKE